MDAHIADLRDRARPPAWIITCSSPIVRSTARCANILRSARGEIDGPSCSLVSRRALRSRRAASICTCCAATRPTPQPVQLADVFRAAHAKLHQAPPPALSAAACRCGWRFCCCWRWPSPILLSIAPRLASSGDKLVLLVVDNSFSMRAGTRLADAKQQRSSVLASRKPARHARRCWRSAPSFTCSPSRFRIPARCAPPSKASSPATRAAASASSARAVRSMAETVHTPIELHLFSDMQRSDMPASFSELALPANVTLVLHPVVKARVPNWTVESVNAPGQVWDPKKDARAGRDRRLPHSGRHAHGLARRQRQDRRHAAPCRCPPTAAPPSNSSRSTCPTASAAAK